MKIPNNQESFDFVVRAHNLMVNPNDTPEEGNVVLNENGERVFFNGDGWYTGSDYYETDVKVDTPKIWYEIPVFDNLGLESLSKEELIQIILKERGQI